MKRAFAVGIATTALCGALVNAPVVGAITLPPLPAPEYAAATRAPVIDSVNDRWRIQVSFGPLTQLRETIANGFAAGGTAEVILVPQLVRRQISIGKWVGDVCTDQTRPGPRTWQFVGSWGRQLESQGNWQSIRTNQPIQIITPTSADGSVFAAGDVLCITQNITWKAGYPTLEVTQTTGSLPGIAPEPLPILYAPGETYADSLPAPAASAINDLQEFTATFGPLTQTRNSLVRRGYEDPKIVSRQIRIGRLTEGRCELLASAGGALQTGYEFVGSWGRDFQNNTAWNKAASGTVRLRTSGQAAAFAVGETPCVYQRIAWTDQRFSGRVTFDSAFVATPNAIPSLDISIDPPPILPDGAEIVLPDFGDFDTDEGDSPTGDLGRQFSLDEIRIGAAAEYISGQLGRIRGASNAPSQAAEAVTEARSTLQEAAQVVTTAGGDGTIPEAEATQLLEQLTTLNQEVQTAANESPIRIAGGLVTASQLGQAVGFDSFQSPIAGTNGSGSIGALQMSVRAAKQAARGRPIRVAVKLRPTTARGAVRVALVTKSGQGIRVLGAKRIVLKRGQAATRIVIPRAAARGRYTLVTSYVPAARAQSGLTVLSPIRVR